MYTMINNLQRFKFLVLTFCAFFFVASCAKDDAAQSGYGYVQFKIYKEYTDATRAVDELEYLNDAKKVRVTLTREGSTSITQTMILSAYNSSNAEYGLRSDKLELLTGEYTLTQIRLYDAYDAELYVQSGLNQSVSVVQGGLTPVSVDVNAKHYADVNFTFTKKFIDTESITRATSGVDEFIFINVGKVNLTIKDAKNQSKTIEGIEVSYEETYTRDEDSEATMQGLILTSTSYTNLEAGDWTVTGYQLYTKLGAFVAGNTSGDVGYTFTVQEGYKQEVDIPLVLSAESAHIQDYIALKAIWEALDGENWYYQGRGYPTGVNWNFDKEIDMWGYQHGITMHANGRIASIDLSDFGVRGHVPEAIGQLTELVQLYLGTHSSEGTGQFGDGGMGDVASKYRSVLTGGASLSEVRQSVWDESVDNVFGNPAAAAISKELRLAYTYNDLAIPGGISLEQEYKKQTRTTSSYNPTLTSEIDSISYAIGKCEKLQVLFIANTTISELPDELGNLTDLTDLELYNLPNMTTAPLVLKKMQALISLNISEMPQLSAAEIKNAVDYIAESPAKETIQLLYCFYNNLEVLPESLDDMPKLALAAFGDNNIVGTLANPLPSYEQFRPVQFFLGNNKIEAVPEKFIDISDLESMDLSGNLLTEVPNCFNVNTVTPVESVSLNNNRITKFPEGFNGMAVENLNLSQNYFTAYPAALANSNSVIYSINLSYNQITEWEEGCFDNYTEAANLASLRSIDLQYNQLTELPSSEFHAGNLPYLYGVDLSYNRFDHFPFTVLDPAGLTVFIFRGQRDEDGNRIMKQWPTNISRHYGIRALMLGSNDLRVVDEYPSTLLAILDIADNPNISIDITSICYYVQIGYFSLYYDKTQDIRGCTGIGLE